MTKASARLRALGYRIWHRTVNRWHDVRAVLAGYCNDCPWRPEPGRGGGYTFWRCALPRRHEGLHRSRNYVWSDDGKTDCVPVPITARMPDQPWFRNGAPRLRQDRKRRRWLEARYVDITERRGSL